MSKIKKKARKKVKKHDLLAKHNLYSLFYINIMYKFIL